MFGTVSPRRGFTLIESLVVMATIILLASIVIPALMGRAPEGPSLPDLKVPGDRGGVPPVDAGPGDGEGAPPTSSDSTRVGTNPGVEKP